MPQKTWGQWKSFNILEQGPQRGKAVPTLSHLEDLHSVRLYCGSWKHYLCICASAWTHEEVKEEGKNRGMEGWFHVLYLTKSRDHWKAHYGAFLSFVLKEWRSGWIFEMIVHPITSCYIFKFIGLCCIKMSSPSFPFPSLSLPLPESWQLLQGKKHLAASSARSELRQCQPAGCSCVAAGLE